LVPETGLLPNRHPAQITNDMLLILLKSSGR
jgi:hypothetical protein